MKSEIHKRHFPAEAALQSIECSSFEPIYWYHPDYLGHTDFVTDRTGQPYQHFFYAPFGDALLSQHSGTGYYNTPYRFNAKELDAETGLIYYGARYYMPKESVWMSVDPKFHAFPHVSAYNFMLNNPIMMVDPGGDSVISIYDRILNKLYIVDLDHYKSNLPVVYVGPEDYELNGIYNQKGELAVNQVLVIPDVFTGGQANSDGTVSYGNKPEQLPIPNGKYEILEDTDDIGYYRLDAIDSKLRNDRLDNSTFRNSKGELRSSFRAHIGSLSHGCVTFIQFNSESKSGFIMFEKILNQTSTSVVKDQLGFLNGFGLKDTPVKKYGTLMVK